jgi:hypothetical protein
MKIVPSPVGPWSYTVKTKFKVEAGDEKYPEDRWVRLVQ